MYDRAWYPLVRARKNKTVLINAKAGSGDETQVPTTIRMQKDINVEILRSTSYIHKAS